MNYLFAGGGTAGHINPALAIANEIAKRDKSANFLFIGTNHGMEKNMVPQMGFDIEFINISGFKRSFSPGDIIKNIQNLFKVITSSNQAKRIINKFKPDWVIGTGGYVSGPVLKVASSMRIKTLIHEQNAFAGMTNKMLSGMVDVVCVSFPNMEKVFPNSKKVVLTGNPVRGDIFKKSANPKKVFGIDNKMPTVGIIGGSLGSEAINKVVLGMIKKGVRRYNLIWSTGKKNFTELVRGLKIDQPNVKILPYIDDMASFYGVCDLIVSRSGAIAVAEIALTKTPSILIPSPNVTDNHQEYNAKILNQGAILLLENYIDSLPDLIEKTLFNKNKLHDMKDHLGKYGYPNATSDIASIICG